jgi:undecaprenyl-diphosphatase
MIRDFTALGGSGVLILLVTAVTSYLFMLRQYKNLAILLTAVLGGLLLSYLLKDIFDRPRPDLIVDTSAINSRPASPAAIRCWRLPPTSRWAA